MNTQTFDQVKLLAQQQDKSPFFGTAKDILDGANERLVTFLSDERFYAPNWWVESWDDNLQSPITLLAEKGVNGFLQSMEMDADDEIRDTLGLFLTDIVRVEWQFAQLLEEKPEHTESYVRGLRQSYRQIADRMKEELPQLSWASRTGTRELFTNP